MIQFGLLFSALMAVVACTSAVTVISKMLMLLTAERKIRHLIRTGDMESSSRKLRLESLPPEINLALLSKVGELRFSIKTFRDVKESESQPRSKNLAEAWMPLTPDDERNSRETTTEKLRLDLEQLVGMMRDAKMMSDAERLAILEPLDQRSKKGRRRYINRLIEPVATTVSQWKSETS